MDSVAIKLEMVKKTADDNAEVIKYVRKEVHALKNNFHGSNATIEVMTDNLSRLFDASQVMSRQMQEFHDKVVKDLNDMRSSVTKEIFDFKLEYNADIVKKNFIKDILIFMSKHFFKVVPLSVMFYIAFSKNTLKEFFMDLMK